MFIDLGRALADVLLAASGRECIKRGVPQHFLEAVPRLYGAYHTVGTREVRVFGDSASMIRTHEPKNLVTADHCWTVIGWLQRGLELSGADIVLVTETSCRSNGARTCDYWCEWHVSGPTCWW